MSILNGTHEAEKLSLVTGKPMKKPIFHERVTKMTDPQSGLSVRVWRAEKLMSKLDEADEDVLAVFKAMPGGVSVPQLVAAISSLEGIAAVEVTDRNGFGYVEYYEW